MRPFDYAHAAGRAEAIRLARPDGRAASDAEARSGTHYLAGGTTLVDLMKLDVLRPQTLVDINALTAEHGSIALDAKGLRLGSLARMATVADHADVRREYPAIAQSLQLAASAQLRNMASLGGNVLQRTRCSYFRDVSWGACNKRVPGSGCAAIGGVTRKLAVLGTSPSCIANYPGDFAVALAALGATVDLDGQAGPRTLPFTDLHRLPGDAPHIETVLRPGELIVGFHVPPGPWTRRSLYLKVRDRQSYEFALASAAVALDLQDGVIREARIGLGGVATKPWRSIAAERSLLGQRLSEATASAAAEVAFTEARAPGDRAFKPQLGRRTLVRALLQCAAMEV